MNSPREDQNRRMLRARDAMDRNFAEPLDIKALAAIAHVSESHFIRTFAETFNETPHRYLQRRRVERAMYLLRSGDLPITEICFQVGFSSLGTFSRTFTAIVGDSPSGYRRSGAISAGVAMVPNCFVMAWTRPSAAAEKKRPEGTGGSAGNSTDN